MDCSVIEAYYGAIDTYEQACQELGRMIAFDNPTTRVIENQAQFVRECLSRVQSLHFDYQVYMEDAERGE